MLKKGIARRIFDSLYQEAGLPADTQKSLFWIFVSNNLGALFGLVCGGGTAAMIGLATALGANDVELGLLVSIPQIATILQIFYSGLVNKTQKRRAYILKQGVFSRMLWVPLGLLYVLGKVNSTVALCLLISIIALESILAGIINVTWYPLFSDLAPLSIRGRWLSIRTAVQSVLSVVFALIFAQMLDTLPVDSRFGIIFFVGGVLGVLDLLCYYFVKEPPQQPLFKKEKEKMIWDSVCEVLHNEPFMRFVLMWSVWCFTANMSGSYLSAYSMNVMHLNYTQITLFGTITSAISTVIFVRYWGKVIDRYGSRNAMALSCSVASLTPLLFLLSSPGNIWPVFLHNMIGAAFWSGSNLAACSMQLSMSPENNRPMYLALYACIAGLLGTALGTMCGGFFLNLSQMNGWFTGGLDRYQVLILLSVVLRVLGVVIMVPRMSNESEWGIRATIRQLFRI